MIKKKEAGSLMLDASLSDIYMSKRVHPTHLWSNHHVINGHKSYFPILIHLEYYCYDYRIRYLFFIYTL